MTSNSEAIAAVIESGRGTRPYSLENKETEQVLNIALALLVELAASNERIDRLEHLLAETRGVDAQQLRETAPTEEAVKHRQLALEAMQLRVLRVLLDPREATDGRPASR